MPRKSPIDRSMGLAALARLLGYPPVAQDKLPGFELIVEYREVGVEEMVLWVSCPQCKKRAKYTIRRHYAAYNPDAYHPMHGCSDGSFHMSPVYLGKSFTATSP